MIKTLVLNTIIKEYRNKSLIPIFLVTFAYILGVSYGLEAIEETAKASGFDGFINFKDQRLTFTLSFVQFWAVFICAIMGTGLINSEFNNNIISTFLVLPLKRSTYLLSRLFGGSLILGLFLFICIVVIYIFNWAQLSSLSYFGKTLLCLLILFAVNFSSLLIAVLINLFTSEKIGLMFTLLVFTLIYTSNIYVSLKTTDQILEQGLGIYSSLALLVHYLFPQFGNMVWMGSSLFSKDPQSMNQVLSQSTHFVITSGLWMWCAFFVFKRKEL
jgi:ABC-type transport system involved in multi-copper enzyme maturation permease subunit